MRTGWPEEWGNLAFSKQRDNGGTEQVYLRMAAPVTGWDMQDTPLGISRNNRNTSRGLCFWQLTRWETWAIVI